MQSRCSSCSSAVTQCRSERAAASVRREPRIVHDDINVKRIPLVGAQQGPRALACTCAIQCPELICETSHPAAMDQACLTRAEVYRCWDFCPCSAIKVVGFTPDQASAYDINSGIGPITACADPCMLPNSVRTLFHIACHSKVEFCATSLSQSINSRPTPAHNLGTML